MRVLGLSAKAAENGKAIIDGGVCIIKDGQIIVAVSEERISRIKHDNGYSKALSKVLNIYDLHLKDFDKIILSSCCEPIRSPSTFPDFQNPLFQEKLEVCSHHLSHAYSGFFASPFVEALVIVLDAGGNVSEPKCGSNWWNCPREQNSYYLANKNGINLIDQDFNEPLEVGFGEAYRAFTHYLGWKSHRYSSNTMAIAAFGDYKKYKGVKLFDFIDGKLKSRMINNPPHPIQMVSTWAKEENIKVPQPRCRQMSISQEHFDLAKFVQTELEDALIKKIRYLIRTTDIHNVCLVGGVALNCVANGKILQLPEVNDLFVQPAANDLGQALGNAYYGYYKHKSNIPKRFTPYLGPDYDLSYERIEETIADINSPNFQINVPNCVIRYTAELLKNGMCVGWFQGRSEFGPRALGNRSILGDPSKVQVASRIRKIKGREWFRPFAPSVLEEDVSEYFKIAGKRPFMTFAAEARDKAAVFAEHIIHFDGTSRLQTVSKEDNPKFHQLISYFKELTGLPMLLNTSFNCRGNPIVETPRDAIVEFARLDLDALIIGDVVVTKTKEEMILPIPDLFSEMDYDLAEV